MGVKLGRKKTRDSELIRKLYLTGVTFREIGRIAKVSSGAVSAEVRELKKELEDSQQLEKALKEREFESVKVELERTRSRVATLECKVPEEHKERKDSTSENQESSSAAKPLAGHECPA